MTIFVRATEATEAKTKESVKVGIFLAGVLTVIAVLQLTTFDTFIAVLSGFNFPGGETTAFLVAVITVIAEVFALPFLLRMRLSPAFRIVSMVFGWIAVTALVKFALWMAIVQPPIAAEGTLSELLSALPGWWMVFGAFGLVVLAVWAAWGMWPRIVVKTYKS